MITDEMVCDAIHSMWFAAHHINTPHIWNIVEYKLEGMWSLANYYDSHNQKVKANIAFLINVARQHQKESYNV